MNRNSCINIAKLWVAVALLCAGLGSSAAPYFSNTFDSGFQNSGVIPDGSLNGWSDTRTVSGSGIHHVSDVRVALTLSGGDNGDLYAYLVHTNGLTVLLNRVGLSSTNAFGADHNGFDLTFSAAGAQNVHSYQEHSPSYDGSGRLTGTWQPDGRAIDPLSNPGDFDAAGSAGFGALSGLDPHGEWTLFIADVSAGGGAATVVSWTLEIDAVTEPASQLAVTSINGGAPVTAGTPLSVEIRTLDLNGEFSNVSSDTVVTVSLDTGNGTLGGTLSGTITNGTSTLTLTGVTYSRAETGVILTATRDSGDTLAADDSSAFDVNPGAFAKLQVLMPGQTASPGSVTGKSGSPSQQTVDVGFTVTVRAVDAHWNFVSNITDTVAITATDSGASLPSNAALSGGTGDFQLTFYTAGTQTVTASDVSQPSITPDTGSSTSVAAGTIVQLTFTTQPDGAAAGSAFTQQPVIRTRDAYGNDSTNGLPSSLPVTVTLSSGTGTLQGTTQLDIGSSSGDGTVSFLDLQIDAHGSKVLTASAAGLTNAVSDAFTVANVAPEVAVATFTRGPNVTLKILISNLLTNATDLNGDHLALSAVSSTSTNGAVIRTNATYLLYSLPPAGNVTDAFTYTVTDGLLSTTGTARVAIQPDPTGLTANLVAYGLNALGQPTMTFAGVPGYHYLVQRTTSLAEPPTWVGLETILAPAGGLFHYTDTNAPTGVLFYRAINQ